MNHFHLNINSLLEEHKGNNIINYASRFKDSIINLYKINSRCAINEIKKLNNCRESRRLNGKISLQRLFKKYWNPFLKICEKNNIIVRESIIDNINSLLTCGDLNYGYSYYECSECGSFEIIPFTCKSRFCPSCGYKYREERTLEIKKKCIDTKHRHMVFTISDKLRKFFQIDRSLIDDLFEAVNLTFKDLEYEFKKNKKGIKIKRIKREFGFISTLHTFGRDLKFNPHLHVIVAEAVLEKGRIKDYNYFNYEKIRKCFMYNLIKLLNKSIKNSDKLSNNLKNEYKTITSTIFNEYDNGFYCFLPPIQGSDKNSNKKLIEYITRYSGHPAISESRILNIDYNKDEVTYVYIPHEDKREIDDKEKEIIVTESVYDFIAKLIVHIPENNTHNIRYYGFYSNKSKSNRLVKKEKGSFYSSFHLSKERKELYYRYKIIKSFDYDPLMCPKCGNIMKLDLEMCYIPEIIKRRVRISYG